MSRAHLRILSIGLLLVSANALRAADDDPKAIIARGVKAHGGVEKITKYQAARSTNKGKLKIPGVGEVEFTQEVSYMLPDKLKDTLSFSVAGQAVSVVTLVNGDTIAIEANGNAVDGGDAVKESIKAMRYMVKVAKLASLVQDKGYEFSLVGEVKVEDKPAVGIRVVSKGQKDINLFFSKETGLLVKIEHRTMKPGGGGEVTEERIIQSYEKGTDGLPVPKKVLIKHDGETFAEAEVIEFNFLEKIDASEFKK